MPRSYGTTVASPYSAAPAVGAAGDTYWDSTTKSLYVSDGTAWCLCVGPGKITGNELGIFAVTTTTINANAVIMNKLVAASSSPATIARVAAGSGNYAQIAGAPVVICTSSTRPTGAQGLCIYETDTNNFLVYTTATTGWVPPWNMPWGEMAYSQATASQTGIGSTVVDLTNLSATFTAVANRKVVTTLWCGQCQNITAAGTSSIWLADAANAIKGVAQMQVQAVPSTQALIARAREVTTAGTFTRKGRATAGAGTMSITGSTTQVNHISIEDVGPSAAPA